MLTRSLRSVSASVLFLAALAGCSKGPTFPQEIVFDGEKLTQARSWQRGKLAGTVWTRPGEKVPSAELQIGVIVSDEHQTAKALNQWITQHSDGQNVHATYSDEETCRAGMMSLPDGRVRTYMSLVTCQTGVGRAACVEADEDLDSEDFTQCLHRKCEVVCDQRWEERREALDGLATSMLTKR